MTKFAWLPPIAGPSPRGDSAERARRRVDRDAMSVDIFVRMALRDEGDNASNAIRAVGVEML